MQKLDINEFDLAKLTELYRKLNPVLSPNFRFNDHSKAVTQVENFAASLLEQAKLPEPSFKFTPEGKFLAEQIVGLRDASEVFECEEIKLTPPQNNSIQQLKANLETAQAETKAAEAEVKAAEKMYHKATEKLITALGGDPSDVRYQEVITASVTSQDPAAQDPAAQDKPAQNEQDQPEAAKGRGRFSKDSLVKISEGTKKSWENKGVAKARAQRNYVCVDGKVYKSVTQASLDGKVKYSIHIQLRKLVKKFGHVTLHNNGTTQDWVLLGPTGESLESREAVDIDIKNVPKMARAFAFDQTV